jgi:hypothetical protein
MERLLRWLRNILGFLPSCLAPQGHGGRPMELLPVVGGDDAAPGWRPLNEEQAAIARLRAAGLSETQIQRLIWLRRHGRRPEEVQHPEAPPALRRLEFARWLVQQGYLSEFPQHEQALASGREAHAR